MADTNEPAKAADGFMSLTEAISLTSEARVIISSAPPHIILHTSPAFFMISGRPFHTIQSCPLSGVLHVDDEMREAIKLGKQCSTSKALIIDGYTGTPLVVRVTSR